MMSRQHDHARVQPNRCRSIPESDQPENTSSSRLTGRWPATATTTTKPMMKLKISLSIRFRFLPFFVLDFKFEKVCCATHGAR